MMRSDIDHRFGFHPADTKDKQMAHSLVRVRCLELAQFLNDTVPEGREKSLAITNLEQAMMWANAAIARDTDDKPGPGY